MSRLDPQPSLKGDQLIEPLPSDQDPIREIARRIAEGDVLVAFDLGRLVGSTVGKGERLRHG